MTDPYNPFAAPTQGFQQRPQGFSYDDLNDPLLRRSIASPMPYSRAIYTPDSGGSYYSPDAGGGAPAGISKMFPDVGKTSLQLSPNMGVPQTTADYTNPPPTAPISGLEGMGRGLIDFVAGGLPPEWKQQIYNGWAPLSHFVDMGLSFLGNMPAIPFPQDIAPGYSTDKQGLFNRLPETSEKARAEAAMKNDPAHALWYMSEYLRLNEDEIAKGLGANPLFADYLEPVNNLGDQITKTLGIVGVLSNVVARSYAGTAERGADITVLQAPMDSLPEPLQVLRKRLESGQISHDDFLDSMTRQGFGYSNDPGVGMVLGMILDPMNLVFGVGVAAKVAEGGAMAARAASAVRLARDALGASEIADMEAYSVSRVVESLSAQGIAASPKDAEIISRATNTDRVQWLSDHNHNQFMDQALSNMSPREQTMVRLNPLIQSAAKVSQVINSPFDLWGMWKAKGKFANGERIAAFSSYETASGMAQAFGADNVLALQKFAEGHGALAQFTDAFGRGAANGEVAIQRDSLVRMAVASGSKPAYSPDIIVKHMAEVYNSRLAIQAEGFFRRIKRQFLPAAQVGSDAYVEEIAKVRRLMGQYLGDILGPNVDKAAILKFTEHANEDMLSFIDEIHWGWIVGDGGKAIKAGITEMEQKAAAESAKVAQMSGKRTLPRQQARAERAASQQELFSRATIIGPHLLTVPRAKRVLADIKAGRIENVRAAVEQYSMLYENFAAKGLPDDEFMRDLETYVQELLGKGNKGEALVRIPERAKLPPAMRAWNDRMRDVARRAGMNADDGYQIGIAPALDQRWRTIYDGEGKLVGLNAWTDVVPDIARVNKLNSLSVVRDSMFRPIRGERLLEEARRRFSEIGVRDYEMSIPETKRLFSAIRQRAGEVNTMPRGLTAHELERMLDSMDLSLATKQRIGKRGMARMVAEAFEGQLGTVGLTQKITGRMKTAGSRAWGNNWLGVVAERLYPMVRFTYNPIFIAQEAVEPYFWNLLHGIKPGMRWRPEDVRAMEMMRRSGLMGDWADQWEYSPGPLLMLGQKEANRIAGPNTMLGKVWGNYIGTGRRVQSLAELKRLNYIRSVDREFGMSFKEGVQKLNPGLWDDYITQAGTADPQRVAQWYWLNKGLAHPDDPLIQTLMQDGMTPSAMGKMAKVRSDELARVHHYVDMKGMQKAIRTKGYSESEFRDVMNAIGYDPAYIDRAWRVTTMNVDEWYDSLRGSLTEARGGTLVAKKEARSITSAFRQIVRGHAQTLGYDEGEYLALHMSRPVKYVASAGDLPGRPRYQLAQPEDFKAFYGRDLLPADHEEVRRISHESRAVAGTPDAYDTELLRQAEAKMWVDSKVTPIDSPIRVLNSGVNGELNSDGGSMVHWIGPGMGYDDIVEMAHNVMGADGMERAVLAHRMMPSMFQQMSQMLPDDVVWRLTEEYFPQPGNIHMNRLRVEAMDAKNLLRKQQDIASEAAYSGTADASQLAARLEGAGSGADYYVSNSTTFQHEGIPLTGPPNSGVHFTFKEYGDEQPHHMFGWYGENGDLVSTAKVSTLNMDIHKLVRPTTPGGPIDSATLKGRVTEPGPETYTNDQLAALQEKSNTDMFMFIATSAKELGTTPERIKEFINEIVETSPGKFEAGPFAPFRARTQRRLIDRFQKEAWPSVLENNLAQGRKSEYRIPINEVALVGTKRTEQGKGYYQKLTQYVDQQGTFNWSEITGRGSYDYPGSKAAAGWLAKKDTESLQAAREALASRMMAGYSYVAQDVSPYDSLAAIQGVIESMSGKTGVANEAIHQPVRDLLDFSNVGGSEFTVPTWRQREMLESLLPASVRNSKDAVSPTMDALRAHGWTDEVGQNDLRIGVNAKRFSLEGGDELPAAYQLDGVHPDVYAAMRDDYRQFAAKANAEGLLNRTDWTPADLQAMNIARYRHVVKDSPGHDAFQLLRQRTALINTEFEPMADTVLGEAFPKLADMQTFDDIQRYIAGLDQVQAKMLRWWSSKIGDISGVSVIATSMGPGRKVLGTWMDSLRVIRDGLHDDLERDRFDGVIKRSLNQGLTPEDERWMRNQGISDDDIWYHQPEKTGEWQAMGQGMNIVVTGSDASIEAAVLATGSVFQRKQVLATSLEGAVGGPPKAGWTVHPATEFVMPKGADEDEVARLVDAIWHKDWTVNTDDLIRMTIPRPDGTRVIRVMHGPVSGAVEEAYPISEEFANRLTDLGVFTERKDVRTFTHEVDIGDWANRRAGIMSYLNDTGEFTDAEGKHHAIADYSNATGEPNADWKERAGWRANDWTDPWIAAAESRGYPHVVTGVRNRYRGEAVAQANQAYWQYLPDYLERKRAGGALVPPPARGYHFQYGPQGVRGATLVNDMDASMFMLKGAGADTAAHEFLHAKAPQFEDSMVVALQDAYSKATGLRLRKSTNKVTGRPALSRPQEEWVAKEFEKYATTAVVSNPVLQSGFNALGKLVKQESGTRKLAEANEHVKGLFDQLFNQDNAALSAVNFNPDEFRVLSSARYMMAHAEDAAHKRHYYARGRNLLERSINHPYLGFYPASYMWGKVVPELVNFLVREPFGVKAPLWGLDMAAHITQGIQLQLSTDKDFKDMVDSHPEVIRFLMMMLPGTPWDLPVNAPAWARHTAQTEMQNSVREQTGGKPVAPDVMGQVVDTANYAFGVARSFETLFGGGGYTGILPELGGAGQKQATNPAGNLPPMWQQIQQQQGNTPAMADVNAAASELGPLPGSG